MGEQRRWSTLARKYRLRKLVLQVILHININFDDNQQAYHYLVNQDRSAWTCELDRKPTW
jgi:hypothetical protein